MTLTGADRRRAGAYLAANHARLPCELWNDATDDNPGDGETNSRPFSGRWRHQLSLDYVARSLTGDQTDPMCQASQSTLYWYLTDGGPRP